MMRLNELIESTPLMSVTGSTDLVVEDVTSDSRKVKPGSLFVAVRGTLTDGHLYIEEAIFAGACALICERLPDNLNVEITVILVEDSAVALGLIASAFRGNPSLAVKLVGVTGTNGKTTIATLLYNMFMSQGYKCGLLSTVCNYIHNRKIDATHTTPDPVVLNHILSEMVEAGCEYVFMEVSSHAVVQKRISGLTFTGGVFTNLTHDHLDYHGTFDNYIAAKKEFFDSLGANAFALVNIDDRNGMVMVQNCNATIYTCSMTRPASFRGAVKEQTIDGMGLRIDGREIWTPFIGGFNAYNLLTVYATSRLLGSETDEALRILSTLTPVAGRLEIIRSPLGVTGLVDYAHTPDALKNVIETINKIREGPARLITVVGAGGNRDRTKRPVMARIAAEGSDTLILTSDNPRNEDPEKILDDLELGVDVVLQKKLLRIPDRRSAIRTAVMMAGSGDLILVAGKGHETYQEVKGVRHHFDDREEIRKAFGNKTG